MYFWYIKIGKKMSLNQYGNKYIVVVNQLRSKYEKIMTTFRRKKRPQPCCHSPPALGERVGRTDRFARLVATLFLSVIVCEVHPELFWGLGGLRTWVGDSACERPLASFEAIRLSDRLISARPTAPFYHHSRGPSVHLRPTLPVTSLTRLITVI